MSKAYKFRAGATRFKGLDAQTIGEELERIRLKDPSQFGPAAIVKEAKRTASSPFRQLFKFNDVQRAAELHWEQQARMLINSVTIVYEERTAPAFIATRFVTEIDDEASFPKGGHYSSVEEIMDDSERRQRLIEHVGERLQTMRDTYRDLNEFARVWTAVDTTTKRTKRKRKMVAA